MGIESDIKRIADALEIIAALGSQTTSLLAAATPDAPVEETPKPKARAKAKPKAEEPKAEEPKATPEPEPTTEEPKAEGPTLANIVPLCKALTRDDPNVLRGILDHFKAGTIKDVKAADYPAFFAMLTEAANG